MSKTVGILTHTDVDGICSATLAKTAYPGAAISFAEPPELALKLNDLPDWDTVIVLDLGINPAQKARAKKAFEMASRSHEIIYIDHHIFPRGLTSRNLPCSRVVHKTNVSASELALDFFKPPRSLEYIALMGAIGDYQERTPRMKKLLRRYGSRVSYLETLLLEQGLEEDRTDLRFRHKIIDELTGGKWPSNIPGMMERARSAIRNERALQMHVEKNVEKIGKKIAIVTDIPFMATGKAAVYAIRCTDAEIGIGAYRDGKNIRISMRRENGSKVNLNKLIRNGTLKLGGTGGGHEAAVGAHIPAKKFDEFLKYLKRDISP